MPETNTIIPHTPIHSTFIDLTGRRFHRWVVLKLAGRVQKHLIWLCRCDCGTQKSVYGSTLNGGQSQSCGCWSRDQTRVKNAKHGELRNGKISSEYRTWVNAKGRCENPNIPAYKWYGARGIEFHFDSVEDLITEVGRRPSPAHSLDRIDNNGHYEKGNVRWATKIEQASNKNNNETLTHNGETLTQAEWARRLGVNTQTVHKRQQLGWCTACTVTIKPTRGRPGGCKHKRWSNLNIATKKTITDTPKYDEFEGA